MRIVFSSTVTFRMVISKVVSAGPTLSRHCGTADKNRASAIKCLRVDAVVVGAKRS